MAFDGIVTRSITRELSQALSGGKVEKIYQPEKDELVFFVHGPLGRVRFYASCNNDHAGIYLTEEQYDNPASPSSFCMLLRKHLQGSRIVSVSQVDTERIIELAFETRDEMGFKTDKKLIIEIMGRHSNIVLCEISSSHSSNHEAGGNNEAGNKREGNSMRIADSIKRVSIDESRARQVLPGQPYEYPPSQDKLPFDKVTADDLYQLPEDRERSKTVLDHISGLSPVMARYISEDPAPDVMYHQLTDIISRVDRGSITPVVYLKDEKTPADFHVVRIPEYEERYTSLSFDKVSEAVAWYYSHRNASNRVRQKAQTLERSVGGILKKLRLKKQRLSEDLLKAENSEKYRLYGELITANIHMMKTGDKEVTVTNYYTGEPITIPLDVRFAPAKNAQQYFKKYSKSKTAIVEKKKQLEETDGDIAYIESVASFLDNAETTEEIDQLRQEMTDAGFLRRRKVKGLQKKQKSRPHEYFTSGGFRVLVGRNNKENDELTMKKAGRMDLWLHTKDFPGSHTILFTEGKQPSEEDLHEAAQIAAWHSKARDSENVPVDITEVRHVKKPSGAKPGMVIFTDNRTVYVTPKIPSMSPNEQMMSSDNFFKSSY